MKKRRGSNCRGGDNGYEENGCVLSAQRIYAVRGACDMLGYDVLQVANEGKMVCVVAADEAEAALAAMKANKYGVDAAIIGEVVKKPEGRDSRVSLRTGFGSLRIMDMLVGEQLPRIC